jgi:hypothetical protein
LNTAWLFEPAHLAVQTLDLLEKSLRRVRRVGRQEIEALPQESPAAHAEEIAHLDVVERVLRQGGVNPVLELRALPDQHHPRARQVALVPEFARRNPDRGQRAASGRSEMSLTRYPPATLSTHIGALTKNWKGKRSSVASKRNVWQRFILHRAM